MTDLKDAWERLRVLRGKLIPEATRFPEELLVEMFEDPDNLPEEFFTNEQEILFKVALESGWPGVAWDCFVACTHHQQSTLCAVTFTGLTAFRSFALASQLKGKKLLKAYLGCCRWRCRWWMGMDDDDEDEDDEDEDDEDEDIRGRGRRRGRRRGRGHTRTRTTRTRRRKGMEGGVIHIHR